MKSFALAHKKIRTHKKPILILLLIVLTATFIFLINRQNYKSGEWEGEGVLNIFPVEAEAKNYRLNAYMEVVMEPRGFYSSKKIYRIIYVAWPNGGRTYFEYCIIIPLENKNICMDNQFRDWKVEIKKDPEIS